jgi:sugar phosphate isomerase/epimerase
MNKIGVMQGRLLPKYRNIYQAHPVGYWHREFSVAKKMELDCIEFIVDYDTVDKNPLFYDGGINEIIREVSQTGVAVKTICADYFMEAPLHSLDKVRSNNSKQFLVRLIDSAIQIGVTDIVIPCVDNATLDSSKKIDIFVDKLMPIIEIAEKNSINISLETDLDPESFTILINRFNSDRLTVNYDIGNSASLGYNPDEELDAYGDRITDVHIKDRLFGGGSVPLGEGDARFDIFFGKLNEFNYTGPFIMQAYRDKEGVEIFKRQLNWIKPYLL